MPTYSLLGATGGTGKAILRFLLSEPPAGLKLNILVRSKSKLLKDFPDLYQTPTSFAINIIEGTGTDKGALQSCLNDTDVIFMCIASNESKAGMSLSFDTASAIIDALKVLHEENKNSFKTPTILQLRSASLNPNVGGWSATEYSFNPIYFCLYHVYADLELACNLYVSTAKEAPDLLNYIFVDPPALHDADGTQRTGYALLTAEQQKTETLSTNLSYADLGAAFCELATRRAEFMGQDVYVGSTGDVKTTWGVLAGYIFQGAKSRIFS